MSRTMRMPYQAVVCAGGLCVLHSAKDRLLWQWVQFTPSDVEICIISPYVHSVDMVF